MNCPTCNLPLQISPLNNAIYCGNLPNTGVIHYYKNNGCFYQRSVNELTIRHNLKSYNDLPYFIVIKDKQFNIKLTNLDFIDLSNEDFLLLFDKLKLLI